MRIILLAAGIGSRLKPLTQNIPKSLLKVSQGETVIERTLNMINRNLNCEVIVVTGFNKDKFSDIVNRYDNCKMINNPFFRITNSISSLWFAREYLDGETIIINADVVFEENLLKMILNIKKNAVAFYDSSISINADYKVAQQDGKVIVMSKELNEFSGEYIGITKFSKEAIIKVKNKIEDMVNNELFNEWYETALVDMIFNDNFILEAVDVEEYQWAEIDNVNDLIKAKKIMKV